jgi:hypothetical protein
MFEIKGKLHFDPINVTKKHHRQSSWKKVAIIKFNDDLPEYYTWFLNKRFNLYLNKPLRGSHMTLINDKINDDIYNQAKEIFDGKEFTVRYNPEDIRCNDKGHWWVKSYCDDGEVIRNSMGLGRPYYGFHITMGRATHLNLEHSNYIKRLIDKEIIIK